MMVTGKVLQFRRGRKNYTPRHFIIEIPGSNSREEAAKYVGVQVEWTSPGKIPKKLIGKISSAHGNNGVVRAIFEHGLPGQALGTAIEVLK
ncbi:MAG: 50S ribosomal protein L35ae [Nanoarchaeota archaeon]|nr:50S ribosomal protein L35ae [Nanoarchaeota archaeon]